MWHWFCIGWARERGTTGRAGLVGGVGDPHSYHRYLLYFFYVMVFSLNLGPTNDVTAKREFRNNRTKLFWGLSATLGGGSA